MTPIGPVDILSKDGARRHGRDRDQAARRHRRGRAAHPLPRADEPRPPPGAGDRRVRRQQIKPQARTLAPRPRHPLRGPGLRRPQGRRQRRAPPLLSAPLGLGADVAANHLSTQLGQAGAAGSSAQPSSPISSQQRRGPFPRRGALPRCSRTARAARWRRGRPRAHPGAGPPAPGAPRRRQHQHSRGRGHHGTGPGHVVEEAVPTGTRARVAAQCRAMGGTLRPPSTRMGVPAYRGARWVGPSVVTRRRRTEAGAIPSDREDTT